MPNLIPRAALLVLLGLAACGRPLAEGERQFVEDVFGDKVDADKVRIASGFRPSTASEPPPLPPKQDRVELRPGVCDRVNPEPPVGPPPAWALYNRMHVIAEFYRPDMLPGWSGQILLPHAMIMAHELVHVWQWQNRRITGYRPVKAGLESFTNRDPYFYVPDEGAGFLEYGFEQQASLVEDYFCYGLFDPQNPRRAKLHAILAPHFRVDRIDQVLAR